MGEIVLFLNNQISANLNAGLFEYSFFYSLLFQPFLGSKPLHILTYLNATLTRS